MLFTNERFVIRYCLQILAFCLIAAVTCAKLPKRPKKDPYADFADDKDLEVPEDDDDKV